MIFLVKSVIPTKSIYMEPFQDLNLNRWYISGLEPEMPVTHPSFSNNEKYPPTGLRTFLKTLNSNHKKVAYNILYFPL
jgi:hypothetical protein